MGNNVVFSFIAVDKFTRVGKRIESTVGSMKHRIAELSRSVRNADKVTGQASARISSGFKAMAAAAAGFFGARAFLTEGMRFQDALADLSAITGATGDDLKYLSDQAMRLAKASKTSQADVAEGIKLVASAKPELLKMPKALVAVTEQVLLLKNATGMGMAQATDVAATSLNQFGAGADQAARFVNVLAAGSKYGASEVSDTGEALRVAGVAAKFAKLSFEETNAAVQVLAANGQKASVAGTGLQGTLIRLETKASKKFRPSVVGLDKALQNLSDAHLNAKQMTDLFGQENLKVAGILIERAKDVGEMTKQLTGSNVAQEQAAIRLRTFSAQLRGLGVMINGFIIKTFLRLEPTLRQLAEQFGVWLESINDQDISNLVDGLKAVGEALRVIFVVGKMVGGVLKSVGKTIGETAAQISLGEWGNLADKALKMTPQGLVMEGAKSWKELYGGKAPATSSSRTDVNVNLRAPHGAVESVRTQSTGRAPGLNIGVNMASEQ